MPCCSGGRGQDWQKPTDHPVGDTNRWNPDPAPEETVVDQIEVALTSHSYATAAAVLRTASDNITRETPLMMRLTPTNVPIAQAELPRPCMYIIAPNASVMIPSNKNHP